MLLVLFIKETLDYRRSYALVNQRFISIVFITINKLKFNFGKGISRKVNWQDKARKDKPL